MTCAAYQRWLSSYIDGLLEVPERRQLESHLSGCANCRSGFESLRQMVQSLRSLELPPVPDLLPGIHRKLEREPFGRRLLARFTAPWPMSLPWQGLAVAASGLLIVVLAGRIRSVRPFAKLDQPSRLASRALEQSKPEKLANQAFLEKDSRVDLSAEATPSQEPLQLASGRSYSPASGQAHPEPLSDSEMSRRSQARKELEDELELADSKAAMKGGVESPAAEVGAGQAQGAIDWPRSEKDLLKGDRDEEGAIYSLGALGSGSSENREGEKQPILSSDREVALQEAIEKAASAELDKVSSFRLAPALPGLGARAQEESLTQASSKKEEQPVSLAPQPMKIEANVAVSASVSPAASDSLSLVGAMALASPAPNPLALEAGHVTSRVSSAGAEGASEASLEPLQLRWRVSALQSAIAQVSEWVSAKKGWAVATNERHLSIRLPAQEVGAFLSQFSNEFAKEPEPSSGAFSSSLSQSPLWVTISLEFLPAE